VVVLTIPKPSKSCWLSLVFAIVKNLSKSPADRASSSPVSISFELATNVLANLKNLSTSSFDKSRFVLKPLPTIPKSFRFSNTIFWPLSTSLTSFDPEPEQPTAVIATKK